MCAKIVQKTPVSHKFKWLFYGHAGCFCLHMFILITHSKILWDWLTGYWLLLSFQVYIWITYNGTQNSLQLWKQCWTSDIKIWHHVICWRIGINVRLQLHDTVSGHSEHRINMLSVTLTCVRPVYCNWMAPVKCFITEIRLFVAEINWLIHVTQTQCRPTTKEEKMTRNPP